jgi:hypothetical protein
MGLRTLHRCGAAEVKGLRDFIAGAVAALCAVFVVMLVVASFLGWRPW